MAKALAFNYTFVPSTNSVTVDGNIATKRLLLITNVTDNIVIQNFADSTKKVVSRSYNGNADETTFVLQYNCSSMSSTDDLQIFYETDANRFEPEDTFVDPVSKIRVSQPNTLIDTDFEYGLQFTKWETLERMNGVPSFHPIAGETPLSNILDVTTNGTNIVTVITSSPHGLTVGFPIDVRGLDSATAEGTFIVKRTSDTTFTYEARSVQAGTALNPVSIITSYINIVPGRFYVGSRMDLDDSVGNTTGPIITNEASPSTLTVKTAHTHGMATSSTFYLVNTLGNSQLSFSALTVSSGGDVEDRSSLNISTGTFIMYEPFHDGTRKINITETAINLGTEEITIPNHGIMTGDMIAYVGVSSGGAAPQVGSVVAGNYPISAGNLPAWAAGTGANGSMLYAVKISKDVIRIATNPKDAYNATNLIPFTGSGSGTLTFSHFIRGLDLDNYIDEIDTTNGSSEITVSLISGFTCDRLKLVPEQQVTIADCPIASLNGVYYVKTTGWDKDSSSVILVGPTGSTSNLTNQTVTATYSMVDSGGNGTTTFNRYDPLTTEGMRFVLHTNPMINHMRASMHDWKSTTGKYFTRECVLADRIFIKNHGISTGQPCLLVLGGNTLSGGTAADSTVYYASAINADEFEIYTTETGSTGTTGPYAATVGSTKATFGTVSSAASLAGGIYGIHPGFTIATFTSQTVSGGAGNGRDRAICKFASLPGYVYEGVPIAIKALTGSTLPTPLINTPDTYTTYQKYYVRTIMNANGVAEFSLSLSESQGPIVDFTGATTAGAGLFAAFRIEENPYSNSFYLKNHGGVPTTETIGGTGSQGTYPSGIGYPGPLFDRISDPGTGYDRLPRVRARLTQATAIGGLTNSTDYNMVPITNDIWKLMAYSATVLPTGQPSINFTNVASRTSTVVFANSAVVNLNANRIVLPSQRLGLLGENSVVRYRNNGNDDIPSSYATWPGLINNQQYIVRNVISSSFFEISVYTTQAYSATATSLVLNDATTISTGDTLKVITNGIASRYRGVNDLVFYGPANIGFGNTIVENEELMLVTNVSGTTITVTRGYKNTTALPIAADTYLQKEFASFQLFATDQTQPRPFNGLAGNTTAQTYLATAHGLRTGETLFWQTGASGNPAWVSNVPYYAIVIDANQFTLADSAVLAQAGISHAISATTATTWTQFYNAVPLSGLLTSSLGSHTLEDTSATGTIDGGYTATSVTATTLNLQASVQVPGRSLTFNPSDVLDQLTGEFFIRNHGFTTGAKVTYTRNALTFTIGEQSGSPATFPGYNKLTNNTEYYAIRTSLNSFKLATTRANAFAGTAITRYSSPGSSGGHTLSTVQVSGESLQSGLATVIARDVVVDGSNSFIIQAGSDRIIATAHGFRTGDRVIYQVWGGGTQINGLVNGRQYFISNSVFPGFVGGASSGQTANQFSLHNSWVGAYTNTDRADILSVGRGRVHQFKVTNPTLFGTTYRGEWSTADSYRAGDVVLFRNSYYMSVTGSDFATGTVVFNSGRQPVADTGVFDVNWMPCPVLPSYGTSFLTQYRGGSRVKVSNTISRTTRFFNGSSGVTLGDDRITATAHGLITGQAVIYRTDARGGFHNGTGATATPYRGGTGSFTPQNPIGGLTINRIYYVNVLGVNDITLHTSPPLALRGGSGDSGNFDFAVELSSAGAGEFHRFEVINNVVYEMDVLAVTNNAEMIVTDPYPSRSITFNPQETNVGVSGLVMQVVDTAQSTIYLPNHGLDTGVKVYYSAGVVGSGTAIGGLTDGQAYYVINLTPDHIRLATSVNNALVGVFQALSNTGTGLLHYLIAASASGSGWVRYDGAGNVNTDTANIISNSNQYTGQNTGNVRDGVLVGLPMIGETDLYVRPDCINVHRPFDGGVEINASRTPNVSIVRQTRKYFRYQSGKGLQYSTGINFSPDIEVSNIVHDGTTWATVTTRKPHKLAAGNQIKVSGVGFTSEVEADKCERDLGYIIDGVKYDVALGTDYNGIFLGLAEVNSLELSQRVQNVITLGKQEVGELTAVATDATALSRANASFDEILDIIQNGRTAANTPTFTNPGTATVSQIAAKDKLMANRAFLAAEVNAWVAINYPNSTHDVAKCTRDITYLINGFAYDVLYGGNSATYDNVKFFFYVYNSGRPGTTDVHRLQTVAAYNRLATVIDEIVQGIAITPSAGNTETQVTAGNNANSGDAAVVVSLANLVVNTIDETTQAAALVALGTKTYPSIAWAPAGVQAAFAAIQDSKNAIIQDIVRGAPYTVPANGVPYFLVDGTNLTDYTFRYRTNGVPADLAPTGYASLFVYSWKDAAVRAGMFDDQNGVFFEYDGQELYCVRRNSTKQLGGTVAVVKNSNTVTGTGTKFTKQLDVGDDIVIRGQSYRITKITSDTVIEINPKYRGTTRSKIICTKTEEVRFAQREWSIDVCDGSGPTGFHLDINKMQMAYIDFSWYGAGKVRYGFKGTDGKVIYVHEIRHNNREVEAYMRSGNLPARYEIVNGTTPTYAPSLYHWGASVIMDGGFEDDKAYLFTVASGSGGSDTITIPTSLAGTPVPVLSIRLAPSVDSSLVGALGERDLINRMSITLKQVGLVVTQTTRPASVRLILNGSLSQAAYFSNYGSPSLTQIIKHTGQTADSINGGVTIFEFRAAANSPVTADLESLAEIGNSILGGDFVFPNGPDILTVAVVTTDTATATQITARITWAESQA